MRLDRWEVRWWTERRRAGVWSSSSVAAEEPCAPGFAVDAWIARLRGASESEQGTAQSG